VLISDVDRDSPAAEAGTRPKDLLLAVNGEKLTGMYVEELPSIRWKLADLPIGKPSVFLVERRDETGHAKRFEVQIMPSEKGKFEGKDFDCKKWNMTVKEISQFRDPDLYFYKKKGVYIRGVRYPGNAQNAGLKRNDIIVRIDNKPVETLDDVKKIYEEIIADKTREKKVTFEILRNGYPMWKVLDYETDYTED
jgi:S1-C subfamily serine protease